LIILFLKEIANHPLTRDPRPVRATMPATEDTKMNRPAASGVTPPIPVILPTDPDAGDARSATADADEERDRAMCWTNLLFDAGAAA
jgi:hypothetical protein